MVSIIALYGRSPIFASKIDKISKKMLESVQKISDISDNTDNIADEVMKDIESQLVAISYVANKVNELSQVTC